MKAGADHGLHGFIELIITKIENNKDTKKCQNHTLSGLGSMSIQGQDNETKKAEYMPQVALLSNKVFINSSYE